MKKIKPFFCKVLLTVLVCAMALGIILPVSLAEPKEEQKATFSETGAEGVNINGVVYAADSTSGAATAAKDYKGGAIFLEPNCTFNMSGGTISGHKNTYGGAIYISDGATFTMTAGTISGNTGTYGGAIYVESGGKCYIRGGTITGNTAQVAPAIYVEDGGTLEVSGEAKIENNKYLYNLPISAEKEVVGSLDSGLELYTTTFGSYPQEYVGDALRGTLESWFQSRPSIVKTFTMGNGTTWDEYNYNGELYVRGLELQADNDCVYVDGTSPSTGRYSWFKVQPIKWYILNYDEWQNGEEEIELYATQVLAGNTYFNSTTSKGNSWETSDIRTWCNGTFYKEAFNEREQELIAQTTIKNNVTGDYANADSDGKAADTEDYVYLKSYYEILNGIFDIQEKRWCANTDFAVGNNVYCSNGEGYVTVYGVKTGYYWLRSAGSGASYACRVYYIGDAGGTGVYGTGYGVRPAMRLAV